MTKFLSKNDESQKFPTNGTIMLIGCNLEPIALQHAKSLLENSKIDPHPDFYFLAPEKEGGQIKIDEVRDFIEWTTGKPQIAKTKVAIITPADALNLQAANALLKTLEEPSLNSLFILVTNKPSFLPVTIRSRCQKIAFRQSGLSLPQPELKELIISNLTKIHNGTENPITVAEIFMKQDPKLVLSWLYVIISESLKKNSNNLNNKKCGQY